MNNLADAVAQMLFAFSEPLLSTDSDELGDGSGAAASDDERAWANVLVDEVDFVHAAEQGRINRNDLHLMERRSSGPFLA